MALRIRKDGRVLCAAYHPPEPGDFYLDDFIHGYLGFCHGGDCHPDTRQLDNYDSETHEYFINGRTIKGGRLMTQQVRAIIWDGTNLREVIDLIGLHPSANKWTWEEYEQVVKEEGLKVFTPDGPVMAEIGEVIVKLKFFGCFVSKLINTKQKEAEECL